MLEIGSAFWEAASSAPYSHPSAIAIFALALLQVLCAYSVVWSFLANLKPALNPGTYAFVVAPAGVQIPQEQIVASVRETEGLSLVIPLRLAHELALPVDYSAAWITLTVHSDLAAVVLTAAFSSALAHAG